MENLEVLVTTICVPDSQLPLYFDISAVPGFLVVSGVMKVVQHNRDLVTELGRQELEALVRKAETYRPDPQAVEIINVTDIPTPDSFFGQSLDHPLEHLLKSGVTTGLAAGIILIYGACHAVAWDTHFPNWCYRFFSGCLTSFESPSSADISVRSTVLS